jgi:hypothetical protein
VNGRNSHYADWKDAFEAFHSRHERRGFSVHFNAALEAEMMDTALPVAERVKAWLLRTAWGNFSEYPVTGIQGTPLGQKDCAAKLALKKTVTSNAFRRLERRGYIRSQGRLWRLNDTPVPPQGKAGPSADYQAFLGEWQATHPEESAELEVARSTVERIRKVILSDYKRSRALRRSGRPILIDKTENSNNGNASSAAVSPVRESTTPTAEALRSTACPNPLRDIIRALGTYCTSDDEAAKILLRRCREHAPDARPEEVAFFVHEKGRLLRKGSIENPIGFLLTVVPKCFEGESFAQWRQQQHEKAVAAEASRARHEADYQAFLREQQDVLGDPNASDEARLFAQKILSGVSGDKPNS